MIVRPSFGFGFLAKIKMLNNKNAIISNNEKTAYSLIFKVKTTNCLCGHIFLFPPLIAQLRFLRHGNSVSQSCKIFKQPITAL